MSKHNYTQYSNKKDDNVLQSAEIVNDEVIEAVTDEVVTPVVEVVEESVIKEPVRPETVKGAVTNCAKLNVRLKPAIDAYVVCVLDSKSEVEVDIVRSTSDWFKVITTSGVEGFCMRKYINTNL